MQMPECNATLLEMSTIIIGIIMSGILAIALVCAVLSMGYWWYKKKLARSKAAMECDTIQIPRIYGNTMVDLKQMEPRQKRYPKKQLSSSSDEDEIKEEMDARKAVKKYAKKSNS